MLASDRYPTSDRVRLPRVPSLAVRTEASLAHPPPDGATALTVAAGVVTVAGVKTAITDSHDVNYDVTHDGAPG